MTITKIHVFVIVLVVRKNMLLSEKVMQRYREFYCCNPRQITLGHHSEHRPLGFSMYFFSLFPLPPVTVGLKRDHTSSSNISAYSTLIMVVGEYAGTAQGVGLGGALAPSLFWLIK